MADHQDPQVEDDFEEFDEEERLLLESHIKKNQASEPAKFQTLYWLIAGVTVLSITYLFQTVLDLNFFEPINSVIFLVSAGATAYFLSDSYFQLYEAESIKGMSDSYGMWIKDLESRRARKWDRIKNKSVKQTSVPSEVRTANDIFVASGKSADQWKALDKNGKQEYYDQESREECAILGAQVADLKHFQYQKSMGWALFYANVLFVGIAVVLSNVLLRTYDSRVNYLISTLATGIITQMVAKWDDSKAKEKKTK